VSQLRKLAQFVALTLNPAWAAVVCLRFHRCPLTVLGAIGAVIINTFQCKAHWRITHICIKVLERLPAFANKNTAPSIILVRGRVGVSASIQHANPYPVDTRSGFAMRSVESAEEHRAPHASARYARIFTGSYLSRIKYSLISAFAYGNPSSVFSIEWKAFNKSQLVYLITWSVFIWFLHINSPSAAEIISPSPKLQFLDNNSVECTGCKLFTYSAGSVSKLATYTDSTGNTTNQNPIVLNSRGETGGIWVPAGTFYKFVLAPANDTDPPTNAFWTVDQISQPFLASIAGVGAGLGIDGSGNIYIPNGAVTPAMLQVPNASFPTSPGGRLTLTTHVPVVTSNQTAKGTIFYDSYTSGVVPIAGTNYTILGNEISLVLSASEEATANVFDIWAINASGTLTLCTATNNGGAAGTGWAGDGGSNTTRGSGYTVLDRTTYPYVTNANAINHCFNATTDYGTITANNATYLGSYFTTSGGQTGIGLGGAASGGTAGFSYVWNMYNRVNFRSAAIDTGSPYNYTSATKRQARASSGNEISFVSGVAEDSILAALTVESSPQATAGTTASGIGLDSTTTFACQSFFVYSPSSATINGGASICNILPQVGLHTISANESSDGVNANLFDEGSLNIIDVTLRN
jgi:hypothetical protein